jgi:hypothetical protein
MQLDYQTFFQQQQRLRNIPFNQTKNWLEHSRGNNIENVRFFVDSIDEPHIACYGYLSNRKPFGRQLNIDGISKSADINSDHIRSFFKSIIEEGYSIIHLSDIDEYNPNFEVGIRRAGLVRPLGLHLCPMSMIVDLQKPFQFHRNWRRNVKKAMEQDCRFVVKDNPTMEDAKEFVRLFGELKERKGLRFSLTPERIMVLLKGNYKIFFVEREGVNICGRISYINNTSIYDVYAANSNEAISVGAAYLIQENIFQYFRERGAERFDYGRIPPSAGKMDNIYIAKSYSGGHPIGYNGEWGFCDKQWKNYLYSWYMFGFRNRTMY